MRLRIKSVELQADTALGLARSEIVFGPRFNILRADNTSGKSTCLQAIIYGLGLEGMLSARREVPLPHSMTHAVGLSGGDAVVQSSRVRLIVESGTGQELTIERVVKDSRIDTALVRTWSAGEQRDFFVRRPGAAQREDGFHHYLAKFLGWDLPTVTRFDGSECPLYLESLFPYFYVEQKHGWSGVQARLPTYLGIRELGKRSAEFVLALDVYRIHLERQRLASAASEMERQWRSLTAEMRQVAVRYGLALSNLPERLPRDLSPDQPTVLAPVGADWLLPDEQLRRLEEEMSSLTSSDQASTALAADGVELEDALGTAQSDLLRATAALNSVREEITESGFTLKGLSERIETLDADLQRHKDAALLLSFGSTQTTTSTARACPTCHQDITDGHDITGHSMTIEENIKLIEQQLSAFKAMQSDTLRTQNAFEARAVALSKEIRSLRVLIRNYRRSLEGPPADELFAAIARRLSVEGSLVQLRDAVRVVGELRQTAANLAAAFAENRRLFSETTKDLTSEDRGKLALVSESIQWQLARYHLSSVSPTDIELSQENYRPVREGFDLGFDLSASDMIRVIWAYLIGMLRVGVRVGNHAGLLILDEPGQQEVARRSYQALIAEASTAAKELGAQIIFATSEDSSALRDMLPSDEYHLIDIPSGEKLLKL